MTKTTVILTEKKNVSKMIAKALAPETFDDRNNCSCEHNDIISLRQGNKRVRCSVNKKNFHYFCNDNMNCDACGFSGQHTDDQGVKSSGSIRKKLRYENKERRKNGWKEIISEDISYYLIKDKDEQILIVDTQGTPYSLNWAKNKYNPDLEKLILNSKNWKNLEQKISYSPSRELKEGSSHRVRATLFDCVFVDEKSPVDGKKIKIDKIIAATDYDIAGSYIIESVLESAKKKGANIDINNLFRMKLLDSNSEMILKEYKNPESFDWGNAYAGKLRSLFDFFYGLTLSNSLNYFKIKLFKSPKRSIENGKGPRFSVGRTKFLCLNEIIQQKKDLVGKKCQDYAYIVFKGLVDKKDIEKALSENNYSAVHVRQKKNNVSLTSIMRSLEQKNVGTHTTRYKLVNSLSKSGLLTISDDKKCVKPTSYGKYFYDKLKPLIDNPQEDFSLSNWNEILYAMMQEISKRKFVDKSLVSKQKKDISGKDLDNFMDYFLSKFKPHLKDLRKEYRGSLVKDLVNAYIVLKPKNIVKHKQESQVSKEDKLIGLEEIKQFIDIETNKSIPNVSYVFERDTMKKPEEDYNQVLKNICSIRSEYDFKVLDNHNLDDILEEDCDFTVFRAELSEKTRSFDDLIKKGIKVGKYTKLEKYEGEKEESAHEPLMITDLNLSDIEGYKGRLLVKEYNAPWERTLKKQKTEKSKRVNLKSFKNKELSFEMVENYEYGKVHNFESLLITMLEKYSIPFWETAKMAEEVYLKD